MCRCSEITNIETGCEFWQVSLHSSRMKNVIVGLSSGWGFNFNLEAPVRASAIRYIQKMQSLISKLVSATSIIKYL